MATPDNSKKTAQEVLADFRRNEILEAAFNLTVSKGRHALTMEGVAEQAGVAKGTVYLYFKDKNALIYGLLDKLAGTVTSNMVAILKSEADFRTKLHDLMVFAGEKSREYRELMILIHRTVGDVDKFDESGRSKYEDLYEELLEELQKERERGTIKAPVSNDNIAYAFLAMLKGSALIEANMHGSCEENEIDEWQIVDLFIRGMGMNHTETQQRGE